jgi:hypothetical protein
MVQSLLLLVRRRPVACITGAALLVGAVIAAWVLTHQQTLVPVSGRVTVDGKPLQSGMVTFFPNHSKGNTYLRGLAGKIKDGRYELKSYDRNEVARKGVPPGWYRVVVEGFPASNRGKGAKSSRKVAPADGKEFPMPDIPDNPHDFFSNYTKPRAVEVGTAGAAGACDL